MLFDVIILAAGRSSRSLLPKPLRPFAGGLWITALHRSWRRLGAARVLVVWNPVFPLPKEAVSEGLEIVRNEETDLGPLRSLQIAVTALDPLGQFTFITPIDCPPPEPMMRNTLFSELRDYSAVHPEFRGKGGHPVLATKRCLQSTLDEVPQHTRLDDCFKRQGTLRLPVDDPTVVLNWNDDAAWQSWLAVRCNDAEEDDLSWRRRYQKRVMTQDP